MLAIANLCPQNEWKYITFSFSFPGNEIETPNQPREESQEKQEKRIWIWDWVEIE
jgi:hypothetical protein